MQFIAIPTEQTTAATDAVLAFIVLISAIYLKGIGAPKPWKTSVWTGAFYLLSGAALLGAIAHGFAMSEKINRLLWHPLYLALGLSIALIVVGSVYDILGEAASKRILPVMTVVGAGFFAVTVLWSDNFIIFIVYDATALFFAFGGYVWAASKRRSNGALQMSLGILITIIGAGVQAGESIFVDFICQFDHNGIFHLIQMVGVIFLVLGLRADLLATAKK